MTLRMKPFENIVVKIQNAGNHISHFFGQILNPFKDQFNSLPNDKFWTGLN